MRKAAFIVIKPLGQIVKLWKREIQWLLPPQPVLCPSAEGKTGTQRGATGCRQCISAS